MTKIAAPALSSRHPQARPQGAAQTPWAIKGELILNCNCTVFCPCVVSLGKHAPTEGYCQAWSGIRIDSGHYGDTDLSGLNVGLLLEIPGLMARGNWKAAAFIDDRATQAAYLGLIEIFSGRAKGTTGLFKLLVSEFLGAERAAITYETEGKTRRLMVGKKIQGEVVPVKGKDPERISLPSTPNTGWAATSPSRPPPRAASAPLAGSGTSMGAAPKSVRSTGPGRT